MLSTSLEKPYSALVPQLEKFGVGLPTQLRMRNMHLDPDFEHLTYGDQGERAKQLCTNLQAGDWVVFFAGLADVKGAANLVYAIIGLFLVERLTTATTIPVQDRDINAHSRRILTPGSQDIVVHARSDVSGRLRCCLPIGEYRDRAYRVEL